MLLLPLLCLQYSIITFYISKRVLWPVGKKGTDIGSVTNHKIWLKGYYDFLRVQKIYSPQPLQNIFTLLVILLTKCKLA